jgi:hypothetical protein
MLQKSNCRSLRVHADFTCKSDIAHRHGPPKIGTE